MCRVIGMIMRKDIVKVYKELEIEIDIFKDIEWESN